VTNAALYVGNNKASCGWRAERITVGVITINVSCIENKFSSSSIWDLQVQEANILMPRMMLVVKVTESKCPKLVTSHH